MLLQKHNRYRSTPSFTQNKNPALGGIFLWRFKKTYFAWFALNFLTVATGLTLLLLLFKT